ncbi:hypothetical protein ALC53_07151 [Atta colombica]|uniref:Uncharacterized protein n=1 Tax=Atta colombica TaxID=520822 RepID=A0A195BCS8_9HYME|nr:hypothetical protein ALC53_07151 [Atta colombica]
MKAYILSIEDPRVIESDRNQVRARQRRCWFVFKKHESGLRCKTAEGEPEARGSGSVLFRHRVALRVAWTPATGTASRDPTPPVGGSSGRGGEHTGNRSERDGKLGKGDAVLENVRDDNYALQDDYALLRAPFSKTTSILSRECCSIGEIGLLCPAHGIASLHGHYKAINHINRAKEAGPEGGTRCSSEDGQVDIFLKYRKEFLTRTELKISICLYSFSQIPGMFLMLSTRAENIRKRMVILWDKIARININIKVLKNSTRYFSRVHLTYTIIIDILNVCIEGVAGRKGLSPKFDIISRLTEEKTKKRKKEAQHCGIRKDRARLLSWRSGEEGSIGISWKAISSSWVVFLALMDVYCDCCDSCVHSTGSPGARWADKEARSSVTESESRQKVSRSLGSLDDRRELWFLMVAWLAGNSVKPSQRPSGPRFSLGVLLTRIRGWSFTGEAGCPASLLPSLTSIEGWDHVEDAADAVAPQARKIILRTAAAQRRNGLRKWRDAACVRKKCLRREKTVVVENRQPL